jgi:1A family penicillin-binding protein
LLFSRQNVRSISLPTRRDLQNLFKSNPRLFYAGVVSLFVAAIVTGFVGWSVLSAFRGLPDDNAVRAAGSMNRATTILDVKGRHAFTIFKEQRLHVSLADVSPNLVNAMLAIEDQRFYDHSGIDVVRIAGAAVNNVIKWRVDQGASTITQQVARLTFLKPEKTIRRKLQEAILAVRLERAFTKDQILELYLNKAYFGDGLYGAEAASLGYLGKHASELNVAEAALIAGLVKSPSAYALSTDATRATARRNVVLGAMRDAGMIDEETLSAAVRSDVVLDDTLRREEAIGQYFKEEIRQQLVEWFGWDRVYREGLKVETTLDLDMQRAAEAEVARALADIEKLQARRRRTAPTNEPLQAALVALDPTTGEVRAMVGGRGFAESRFNRATQSKRQPGSAFKPFVYAAALEAGFTPATLISGLSEPIMTFQGAWLPSDEHVDGDAITMRAALRTSSNRAAVQMLQTIGVRAAARYAEDLGLGAMPQVPSLALGSGEVTLQALTSAFGAFANGGERAAPTLIRRVTSSEGEVLYESQVSLTHAVSPSTAFLITSMMQDVINAGTAAQIRQMGFRLPAAGKTGTTSEYRDAWFVGYTTKLVTGVWVGYDKPRTIVPGGYAAQIAVPLWTRFMLSATKDDKSDWFRAPSDVVGVEVDRVSGRRATDACRRTGQVSFEYFAEGTEPIDMCPLHTLGGMQALALAPGVPAVAAASNEVTYEQASATEPADAKVATAAVAPAAPEAPPAPAKKRGFWSRIFGKDRDDKK